MTVGLVLFGGQFVHFLQGPRGNGAGDPTMDSRNQINFAIPSENVLRERFQRDRTVPREAQVSQGNTRKKYVLAMDGKKVAMGLTSIVGDVNMFGHEDSPT